MKKTQQEEFKAGNIYEIDHSLYVLGRFGIEQQEYIVLIQLENGNRFTEPVRVNNFNLINKSEFEELCENEPYKLIGNAQKIFSKITDKIKS